MAGDLVGVLVGVGVGTAAVSSGSGVSPGADPAGLGQPRRLPLVECFFGVGLLNDRTVARFDAAHLPALA